MKLYITRHGETQWNTQKRFQGSKDSELTETGIYQAELLSERIDEIELDYIIASPLKRAYNTAKILNKNKELQIITYDGLKELNLGDFEGMTIDEIREVSGDLIDRVHQDPYNNRYPNGENLIEFCGRVSNTMNEVIDKYFGKNILIVAHGGTINCIQSYLESKKVKKEWMAGVVRNCSLSLVEIDEDKNFNIIYYNDTDHLNPSYSNS